MNINKLLIVIILATTSSSCTPHFYKGKYAELKISDDVEVILKKRSLGDSYRLLRPVPAVYRIKNEKYELRIAHGQRYWPDLFFIALDPLGNELEILGRGVREIEYPKGGDIRRLTEARRTKLTHRTWDRSIFDKTSLTLVIKSSDNTVLGTETINFQVKPIKCFEWNTL